MGGSLEGNAGYVVSNYGCGNTRTTVMQTNLIVPTTGGGAVTIRLGLANENSAHPGTNSQLQFAEPFTLFEQNDTDCVGSWSYCTSDCPDKTYSVIRAKSGRGWPCNYTDWAGSVVLV